MGALFSCMCIGGQSCPDDTRSSTTRLHQSDPSPAGLKDLGLEKARHINDRPSRAVIGVASPRPRLQPIILASDSHPGEHVPRRPSVSSQLSGQAVPLYHGSRVSLASSCLIETPPHKRLLLSNNLGSAKVRETARRLLRFSNAVGKMTAERKYCIFYLALSLHPSARHISYQPQPRVIESKPQRPESASYSLQDHHSCLTRDVKGEECLFHSKEMQIRARNMISLLWLIGCGLDDRSTLLKSAFLDGFHAARWICEEEVDIDLGDKVYAALSSVTVEWSAQLLEIPSSKLYPYDKDGLAPPEVPDRSFDEPIYLDIPSNKGGARALNVKYDYLDLLKPPIDGLTAIPTTKRTCFIVQGIAGEFGIGDVSEHNGASVKWTVAPCFDDDERALEAALCAARQNAYDAEAPARQRASEAVIAARQRASEAEGRRNALEASKIRPRYAAHYRNAYVANP